MKQHLNPPDLFPSLPYGFSQIVTSPPGRLIFLSGQVAWDAQENLVGGDDLSAQTLQAFRNVERALRAAGAAMSDVVSLRLYIVDYTPDRGRAVKEGLLAAFEGMPPPACTWIGVTTLANEGFLIEIEATAVAA